MVINRLIKHPEEMRKVAKAGRSRLETEFDWDKIARKTEEAYANVYNSHASQPSSTCEGSALVRPLSATAGLGSEEA